MRDVLLADLFGFLVGPEIIIAFRQSESALRKVRELHPTVAGIGLALKPEAHAAEAASAELRDDAHDVGGSFRRRDEVKGRLQRRSAGGVDRCFIHAARVEVADLALKRAALRTLRRGALADRAERVLIALGQLRVRAPAAVGGRDRGIAKVGAIDETVEVVLGLHRQIEIGEGNVGASGREESERGEQEGCLAHRPSFPERLGAASALCADQRRPRCVREASKCLISQ